MERAVTKRKPLSPVVGQPSLELEDVNSTEKIMPLIMTIGFIVLSETSALFAVHVLVQFAVSSQTLALL